MTLKLTFARSEEVCYTSKIVLFKIVIKILEA